MSTVNQHADEIDETQIRAKSVQIGSRVSRIPKASKLITTFIVEKTSAQKKKEAAEKKLKARKRSRKLYHSNVDKETLVKKV